MSTTTVSYNAAAEEVSLRDLRRKEEEARKALRRRLGQAQKAVAVQETRYAKLVDLLDARRRHLPDLAFTLPALPAAPIGKDPAAFERHAVTLSGLLDKYERQARQAIAAAEVALERRKLLAAAWTEIHATTGEIGARNQACAALAQQLGNRFDAQVPAMMLHKDATLEEAQTHLKNIRVLLGRLQAQQVSLEKLTAAWAEINATEAKIAAHRQDCTALAQRLNERFDAQAPQRLHKAATLEEAQSHLENIRAMLTQLQAQHGSLTGRAQSRDKARALSGNSVDAVSSGERVAAWEAEKASQARGKAQRTIDAALIAAKLEMASLPKALQLQAAFAIEQAPGIDGSRQLADLINRHRVRLDSIAKAEQMLAEPPQYADDSTGAMASRWTNLVKRLESVICGLAECSASLEQEYRQIQEDCVRAMQRAYAKANFFELAAESDFQLSDGDDGLVLMELDAFPGYYLVSDNQQDDDGYMTRMQLMADPTVVGDDGRHDSAVTEVVCSKLRAMAHGSDANIAAEVREVERKPKVTRKRRPVHRRTQAAQI